MNYKIEQKATIFNVIEKQTGHVVYTNAFHKEAKKMMKHLNLGGGFDGNTPDFFINNLFKKTREELK